VQGVRTVKTGLADLFGGGAGGEDADALVYHRPRDPAAAARGAGPQRVRAWLPPTHLCVPSSTCVASVNPSDLPHRLRLQRQSTIPGAAAAPTAKPEFIFVTTVPGLFFLNPATRSYEGKGTGNIGCVIVGSSAAYNLMFYDGSRVTLLTAPVAQVRGHCGFARACGLMRARSLSRGVRGRRGGPQLLEHASRASRPVMPPRSCPSPRPLNSLPVPRVRLCRTHSSVARACRSRRSST
jgi:hypothetical protein